MTARGIIGHGQDFRSISKDSVSAVTARGMIGNGQDCNSDILAPLQVSSACVMLKLHDR